MKINHESELMFENENGEECNDLLKSNNYIYDFNISISSNNYSTFSIIGDWGSGKTTFVKMWEKYCLKENQYIHIDAFKMDYESEPFMMLIKAFRNYFEKYVEIDKNTINKWLNKAKEVFALKNILKLGFNVIVDKTVGSEPMKDFLNSTYNSCFDELSEEQTLYDELKNILNSITSNFETDLIIIIDELDRCRPDFALETLERVKHLFNVKKVKFILVYNEKIMQSMINQKYGIYIDAKRYLDKFVQKPFVYSNRNNLFIWLSYTYNKIFDNNKTTMKDFLDCNLKKILSIANMYNLEKRELKNFLNILTSFNPGGEDIICVALVSIEILKYVNESEYENLKFYYYNNNNNIFTINSPSKENFIKLLNCFRISSEDKEENNDEIYNNAFNLAMKYYENH